MESSVEVVYDGIPFEISGRYVPCEIIKLTTEGGYFDDCDVKLFGYSVMDVLKQSVIDEVIEMAEDELRGMQ